MHGGFATFDRITDIPFIARHARHDGATVRAALALPADGPLALSSFGGYGVRDLDPSRLDCLDTVGVDITRHAPPHPLRRGVHVVDERFAATTWACATKASSPPWTSSSRSRGSASSPSASRTTRSCSTRRAAASDPPEGGQQ